jgi:hypothetical protein
MSAFDWSDNEVVVVRSYGDIAIYINGHGTDIAIRQEDQFDTDEPVVVVPIDSAEKVATRILELAKVIRAGDSTGLSPRAKLQSRRNGRLPCQPRPIPRHDLPSSSEGQDDGGVRKDGYSPGRFPRRTWQVHRSAGKHG